MRDFTKRTAAGVAALALCACSGGTVAPGDAGTLDGHAGPGDPGSTSSAADGGTLYAVGAGVARVHIDYVFLGQVPGCFPPYRPVDYDRESHSMSWPACSGGEAGAPSSPPPGDAGAAVSRVLSSGEAQQVEAALRAVTYVDNPPCGGEDGNEYYMTTFDAAGHKVALYSAYDINCYGYPAAPGMQSVYELLAMLRG
jgi:hypothetical protein